MLLANLLRIFGALCALGTFVLWAAGGFNPGWTKDRIAVETEDPITGLIGISYEETYIAGVEVLAMGTFLGVALFAVGIYLQRKHSRPTVAQ